MTDGKPNKPPIKRKPGRPPGAPKIPDPSKRPKNTDINVIQEQITRNPGLSLREVGKLNGIDGSAVVRLLQRHGIHREHIEDYKQSRADLFAGMQEKIVACITSEDLQKASLRDKVIAAATLYDKERLERGQSTVNLAAVFAKAMEE